MEKEGAFDLVDSTNDAFSLTVLWGSIGTRETQLNPMVGGEILEGVVDEFMSVITLNCLKERENCEAT